MVQNQTPTVHPSADEAVGREHTRPSFRPDIDIYETRDEIVLVADVPGASGDDIDLNFENGVLDLHARVRPRRAENAAYLVQEYGVGDFHRSFQVSEDVDSSRISAEISGGVLTVRLPKAAAARPRKIEVRSR
jgi:HSP20 family protein